MDNNMYKDLRTIVFLLLFMLLLAVVISMAGCTRTVEKSVVLHDTVYSERVLTDTTDVYRSSADTLYILKKDTVRVVDVRRDSVAVRDSVYVREKGDSVYVYREKWRTKVELRHDTVVKARTDTVVKVRTDTVTVYRFAGRNDSAYHSIDANKKVVKERRTFPWLKILGAAALLLLGLFAWKKWKCR